LNDRGAGVFVVINETDGKGRRNENITRVRSQFVDLDGAPLAPVMAAKLDAGHHHYWPRRGSRGHSTT
jgi:hypothetical protein